MNFDFGQIVFCSIMTFVGAGTMIVGLLDKPFWTKESRPMILGGALTWILSASLPVLLALSGYYVLGQAVLLILVPTLLAVIFYIWIRHLNWD